MRMDGTVRACYDRDLISLDGKPNNLSIPWQLRERVHALLIEACKHYQKCDQEGAAVRVGALSAFSKSASGIR
jgi:hypothetical protein